MYLSVSTSFNGWIIHCKDGPEGACSEGKFNIWPYAIPTFITKRVSFSCAQLYRRS